MSIERDLNQIERKLALLEDQGLDETAEYQTLSAQADELADQLSANEDLQKIRNAELQEAARIKEFNRQFALKTKVVNEKWAELSRSEFFTIVMTNYPITEEDRGQWIVKSMVRNLFWTFPTEIDAKEKVIKLCDWREYNKFDRAEDSSRGRVKGNPKIFIEEVEMKSVKFSSQFLCPELRKQVDSVNKLTLNDVKSALVEAMLEGKNFNNESPHIKTISSIDCHKKLQMTYYNYILAAEGQKVQ